MKIIFLDIDGVLNSTQTYEEWYFKTGTNGYGGFFYEMDRCTEENLKWGPKLVANLRKIVEATGAKIVISSTWRKHFAVEKFVEMFKVYGWDNAPVYDRTLCFGRIRGQEVDKWLKSNTVESYVIIDDMDDFMREQFPFFVHTDPDKGLQEDDVEKAINILNFKHYKHVRQD